MVLNLQTGEHMPSITPPWYRLGNPLQQRSGGISRKILYVPSTNTNCFVCLPDNRSISRSDMLSLVGDGVHNFLKKRTPGYAVDRMLQPGAQVAVASAQRPCVQAGWMV